MEGGGSDDGDPAGRAGGRGRAEGEEGTGAEVGRHGGPGGAAGGRVSPVPLTGADPEEVLRLTGQVAEATPPPPPPSPGSPEVHDSRTEPPPGGTPGGPSAEQVEELLSQAFTEEDLQILVELAFGLIAARRPVRDPQTGVLVWDMPEQESKRIAHWAHRVANKRAWLKKLMEYFPEIMLSVSLVYAGWRRYSREQEILEWQKAEVKRKATSQPPGGSSEGTHAAGEH